jgi:hypothetical protein
LIPTGALPSTGRLFCTEFLEFRPAYSRSRYLFRASQTVRWTAPDWEDAENEEFLSWLCRTATETFNPSAILLGDLVEKCPTLRFFGLNFNPCFLSFKVDLLEHTKAHLKRTVFDLLPAKLVHFLPRASNAA